MSAYREATQRMSLQTSRENLEPLIFHLQCSLTVEETVALNIFARVVCEVSSTH